MFLPSNCSNTSGKYSSKRTISLVLLIAFLIPKRLALNISNCLFCEKGQEDGDLHLVSTFDADANILSMITEVQDTQLLARIEGGDLIVKDAKYHLKCLVSLRNRHRSSIRRSLLEPDRTSEKLNESIVFVELTIYIEKAVYSGTLLFKLSEIHVLYVNCLEYLWASIFQSLALGRLPSSFSR